MVNSSNPSFRLGRIFVSVAVSYTFFTARLLQVFVGKNRIEACVSHKSSMFSECRKGIRTHVLQLGSLTKWLASPMLV
jgi:hypothetical protein